MDYNKSKISLTFKIGSVTLILVVLVFFVVYLLSVFVKNNLEEEYVKFKSEVAAQIFYDVDRELYQAYTNIQTIGLLSWESAQDVSSTAKLKSDQLGGLLVDLGPWKNLFIVTQTQDNNTHDIVASVGTGLLSRDVWLPLVEGLESGGAIYSDVIFDDEGNKHLLFAAPIVGAHDEYLGTVIGEFPWIVVEDIISQYEFDYIFLYRIDGTLLYGSHINTPELEDVVTVRLQEVGYRTYNGNNWQLTISQKKETLFAVISKLRLQVLVLMGTALLVQFIFFIVSLQFLVVRPIRKLTRASEAAARGMFLNPVPVKSRDEIGNLTQQLNEMTEKLKVTYSELKQVADEKTGLYDEASKTLEEKVNELERINKIMIGREKKMIELKQQIEKKNTDTSDM